MNEEGKEISLCQQGESYQGLRRDGHASSRGLGALRLDSMSNDIIRSCA